MNAYRYQLLVCLLLLPMMLFAAGETGLAALKIGVSARASAMGEAFTGVADDASGLFWNPAGLAWVEQRQAAFTYNQWIQAVNHNTAGVVLPASFGTIGLGVMLNSVDGFERRVIASEEPLGTFSTQDVAFALSYARKFGEKLSVGVNARYLYEKIYVETASGYALDLGVRYRLLGNLYAGAALQNLGSMSELVIESPTLPVTMRAGAAWYVPLGSHPRTVLVAVDVVSIQDEDLHIHTGAEYRPVSMLVVRAGYQTGYKERALTGGFGLQVGRFMLDYAYVPFNNDLGNSQRFSLSVNF